MTKEQNQQRMRRALTGLSVGDALGRHSFMNREAILNHDTPPQQWMYTDDTRMALAVADVLMTFGQIEQDALALRFGKDFEEEPERGYGAVAHYILHQLSQGVSWQDASTSVYGGQGSKGNGGAMRVAPLGAYFGEDLNTILIQSKQSAEVTHAHPEGIAGTQAVAMMAGLLAEPSDKEPSQLLELVIAHLPSSNIKNGIIKAQALGVVSPRVAGEQLGTGIDILAEDTVPLCLWLAAHYHTNYEESVIATFESFESSDSDVDTVTAIVGGMVASQCFDTIPAAWIQSTESWQL